MMRFRLESIGYSYKARASGGYLGWWVYEIKSDIEGWEEEGYQGRGAMLGRGIREGVSGEGRGVHLGRRPLWC